LPDLIAAPPDVPVWICEGEKDADNVAALGFVTTTTPGGALKWTRELNPWFAGKQKAYVLEDNDPPIDPKGQRHAREVAEALLDQFIGSQAFIAVPRVGHLCVDGIEQGAATAAHPHALYAAKNHRR
jgi:hypothetical protein